MLCSLVRISDVRVKIKTKRQYNYLVGNNSCQISIHLRSMNYDYYRSNTAKIKTTSAVSFLYYETDSDILRS